MVASDGVFDNLFNADLMQCITHYFDTQTLNVDLVEAANCIGYQSNQLGADQEYYSPFQKGAEQVGLQFKGGKLDDVTVVVAQVTSKNRK